jgi:hypothetical protein
LKDKVMKKILFAAAAFAGVGLGFAGSASAASFADPGINQKERNIAVRIEQGAHGGGLTRPEVRFLRNQLSDIQRTEVRYGRDGFNRWERADLNRRLDVLSDRVFNQRHDGQRRY